jgi:hypothetical protein
MFESAAKTSRVYGVVFPCVVAILALVHWKFLRGNKEEYRLFYGIHVALSYGVFVLFAISVSRIVPFSLLSRTALLGGLLAFTGFALFVIPFSFFVFELMFRNSSKISVYAWMLIVYMAVIAELGKLLGFVFLIKVRSFPAKNAVTTEPQFLLIAAAVGSGFQVFLNMLLIPHSFTAGALTVRSNVCVILRYVLDVHVVLTVLGAITLKRRFFSSTERVTLRSVMSAALSPVVLQVGYLSSWMIGNSNSGSPNLWIQGGVFVLSSAILVVEYRRTA